MCRNVNTDELKCHTKLDLYKFYVRHFKSKHWSQLKWLGIIMASAFISYVVVWRFSYSLGYSSQFFCKSRCMFFLGLVKEKKDQLWYWSYQCQMIMKIWAITLYSFYTLEQWSRALCMDGVYVITGYVFQSCPSSFKMHFHTTFVIEIRRFCW